MKNSQFPLICYQSTLAEYRNSKVCNESSKVKQLPTSRLIERHLRTVKPFFWTLLLDGCLLQIMS